MDAAPAAVRVAEAAVAMAVAVAVEAVPGVVDAEAVVAAAVAETNYFSFFSTSTGLMTPTTTPAASVTNRW